MPKIAKDPISPWFEICEELDEYIGIRFGRISPGGTDPDWTFVRHTDFDGIGGFAELLRRRGAVIPKLPQIKHPAEPSWRWLARFTPKLLRPRRRVKWGKIERGMEQGSSKSSPPQAVAWHVFDEQETTQIRRACRKNGFTVNSFLVKHLTKAIRPYLADESSVVPWMIPTNMRGKVHRDRDTANFTSYVSVNVCSFETVQNIHQQIYAALSRGEHWANWSSYAMTSPLPRWAKRLMLVKELAMSQWHIGSFSNLGDWDQEKKIARSECEGSWLFAPPVLRCQFLGAGCVTFQNRLSLTIQAHPDLTNSPSVPQEWIRNWVKEVEIDLASILPEPSPTSSNWLNA